MIYRLFGRVLFNFKLFGVILDTFLLLIFNKFIAVREYTMHDFDCFTCVLWSGIWNILVNALCMLEKKSVCTLGGKILNKCQFYPFGSWCSVPLCLDFLLTCSIDYQVRSVEISKELDFSLFLCSSINFCFLGAQVFI